MENASVLSASPAGGRNRRRAQLLLPLTLAGEGWGEGGAQVGRCTAGKVPVPVLSPVAEVMRLLRSFHESSRKPPMQQPRAVRAAGGAKGPGALAE